MEGHGYFKCKHYSNIIYSLTFIALCISAVTVTMYGDVAKLDSASNWLSVWVTVIIQPKFYLYTYKFEPQFCLYGHNFLSNLDL